MVDDQRYWTLKATILWLVSFALGLLTGFTGAGVGFLIAPALVYLFGFMRPKAQGTSFVIMLAATVAGAGAYAGAGHMMWGFAVTAALGAIIGAIAGARFTVKGPAIVRRIVAVVLIAAGVEMIAAAQHHGISLSVPHMTHLLAISSGLVAGLLGGVAGVSSGAVLVPIFVIIFAVPQKVAQAIALASAIPAAIPGFIIHYFKGSTDNRSFLWMVTGASLGGYVGGAIAVDINPTSLASLFGIFLVVISALAFSK